MNGLKKAFTGNPLQLPLVEQQNLLLPLPLLQLLGLLLQRVHGCSHEGRVLQVDSCCVSFCSCCNKRSAAAVSGYHAYELYFRFT